MLIALESRRQSRTVISESSEAEQELGGFEPALSAAQGAV
jgi:hypothetical protein